MVCSSHPPWNDNSNCIWRRVQVMKLLILCRSKTVDSLINGLQVHSICLTIFYSQPTKQI
jgi:hypothetical protein